MGIIRLLKPALFIYECLRVIIIAAFMIYSPGGMAFPWLVFAAPCALFPLMALFIWLDVCRYRVYLPLLSAGKIIGISSLLGWSIVSRHFTMIGEFSGANIFEWILLGGDFLAMAAIILINKDLNKPDMSGEPGTEVN